jgi:preprotein translocase subunit SecA
MINQRVSHTIFRVQIAKQTAEQDLQQKSAFNRPMQFSGAAKEGEETPRSSNERGSPTAAKLQNSKTPKTEKVGRNDLCPCGSGKKFKKCHGA